MDSMALTPLYYLGKTVSEVYLGLSAARKASTTSKSWSLLMIAT
jgi:hypothetical protein